MKTIKQFFKTIYKNYKLKRTINAAAPYDDKWREILYNSTKLNARMIAIETNKDKKEIYDEFTKSMIKILDVYSAKVVNLEYEKLKKVKDKDDRLIAELKHKIANLEREIESTYFKEHNKESFFHKIFND